MLVLALATMLGTTAAPPAGQQRLPAQAIVAAVQDAVRLHLRDAGSSARAVVSGRIADQLLPAGKAEVRVGEIQGRLPRPRIAVPVRLVVDGRPVRPMTVWLALSDVREVLTYADDAAARTKGADVVLTPARVDMACCSGAVVDAPSALAGLRTRRAVHAGAPALLDDFEPEPAVAAREAVAIDVHRGLVRVRTSGVALEDGNVGDRVLVRPDRGRDAITSRVVANREVVIGE